MLISRLDHLVLTVTSIVTSVDFYTRLGFRHVEVDGRHALTFGQSKINLHEFGHSFQPAAGRPTPGSGDLCFIVDAPVDEICAVISDAGIEITEGPVRRHGALGAICSTYVRDPDQNLLEFSTYHGQRS